MTGTGRADASPAARSSPAALTLVAAVAENGVIGQGGGLPWRLKSELRLFRSITMGRPVVMGRKTYASIGNPLAGRLNIVISRDRQFAAPGILVASSLEAALEAARGEALRRGADIIAVIGGADLYAQSMAYADRLLISRVHLAPDGDTVFPPIDPALWREVERSEHTPEPGDPAGFTHLVYARRGTHLDAENGRPS